MKRIAFIAIIITLILSGCAAKKTSFFYSFKEEKALENNEGKWYMEDAVASGASVSSTGYYSFEDEGLIIEDLGITYDEMFKGDVDLTYTVYFYLHMDSEHPVTFAIGLTDGSLFDTANNFLMYYAKETGGANEEHYWIDSNNLHNVQPLIKPPSLLIDGRNVINLRKSGNSIRVVVNNVVLEQCTFEVYDSVWFTPTAMSFSDYAELGFGFYIESVGVTFPQAITAPTPEPREGEPV